MRTCIYIQLSLRGNLRETSHNEKTEREREKSDKNEKFVCGFLFWCLH